MDSSVGIFTTHTVTSYYVHYKDILILKSELSGNVDNCFKPKGNMGRIIQALKDI